MTTTQNTAATSFSVTLDGDILHDALSKILRCKTLTLKAPQEEQKGKALPQKIYSPILFELKENALTLISAVDSFQVSIKIEECQINTAGELILPYNVAKILLSLSTLDKWTLSTKDKGLLGAKQNLSVYNADNEEVLHMPTIESNAIYEYFHQTGLFDNPINHFLIDSAELNRIIRQSIFACDTRDTTRDVFKAAYFKIANNEISILGANPKQIVISSAKIDFEGDEITFSVSPDALKFIRALLSEGEVEIAISEAHALFSSDNWKITAKRLSDERLPYGKTEIRAQLVKYNAISEKSLLQSALKLCCPTINSNLNLTFESDGIVMQSNAIEEMGYKATRYLDAYCISVDPTIKTAQIFVNSTNFINVINAIDNKNLNLELANHILLIRDKEFISMTVVRSEFN